MANLGPECEQVKLDSATEVRLDYLIANFGDFDVPQAEIAVTTPSVPSPTSRVLEMLRDRNLTSGNHFFCFEREPDTPTLIVTDFDGMHAAQAGSGLIEAIVIAGQKVRHYVIDETSGDTALFSSEYSYGDEQGSIIHNALTPPIADAQNVFELKISSGEEYRGLITRRAPGVRFLATDAASLQLEADLGAFGDSNGLRSLTYHSVSWNELYPAEVS